MKTCTLMTVVALFVLGASAEGAPSALGPAEEAAAFKAAGFKLNGKQWRNCEDPTPTYSPGEVAEVRDLNGDGRLDAVITEGGTFCFGNTGTGYTIVSKQANGGWKKIAGGTGVPSFLPAKGKDGWPDIEIGGPGFCFPVERWNGKEYVLNRHQYEGKPCRPK
ncbi:hypothetical protein [Massilia yuzhufengensis]|uniref:Uncharacterized protein n=1 Tax=Massilia yuzhufengensis TaxID=1164594 RepID=A0A1I1EX53_9BURK|nr:hypothetical protein [Massilia yuzhufengensis]SFB91557.1 hypothetical protein SAMN05216204_102274 [Massilia yuzhufengensis]